MNALSTDASGGALAEQNAVSGASVGLLAARCRAAAMGGLSLDGASPATGGIEFGDATAYPGGYAVSFIHQTLAGRVAAVALLPPDAASARVVDLGPTLGDAPPPRLAWRTNELLAAQLSLPTTDQRPGDPARELAVQVVEPGPPRRAYPLVPQGRDDSLAFDLAFLGGDGLVVWDEAAAAGARSAARGVIRAASLQGNQRGTVRDVSPSESDAESPRVLSLDAGFIVTWLARRPEPWVGSESSANQEATGEARAYGWLEAIALDPRGNAAGPVRRLTSVAGHVSTYDIQRLPAARGAVLIVARDDGEAVDGSGGGLLRVRVGEDGAEPPTEFPSEGLGRGAPAFVSAPAPWLAWVGPREQLRLLPLDSAGAPVTPPSAEDAFDEARPLVLLRADVATAFDAAHGEDADARAPVRMLVATPNDSGGVLHIYACVP
ncbi:MAG: hypothetical protein M3O36_02405 [Myxococcota bacterium]|nr:hypothetical protein [Myxococcota bacterium]